MYRNQSEVEKLAGFDSQCYNYCQIPGVVFRLGVDFVLPLSQERAQEEQQEEPTPKSIRRGSARRPKFDM